MTGESDLTKRSCRSSEIIKWKAEIVALALPALCEVVWVLSQGYLLLVAVEVGGAALDFDAKDENTGALVRAFGALPMLDDPLKLILPLSVIADAIKMTGARSSGIRLRDDDDPDP